ncbi:MAG: diadenylate cyclase CdaA [Firmicutes bacterium]|nr:diadenylate cyclase CdaA [Bacillota bacterium]
MSVSEFFSGISSGVLAGITFTDIIDVVIVAFVVYKIIGFMQATRAEQLVKGLIVLLIATYLSGLFNLYTLNWILKGTLSFGVIALIIIFQPELRRGLEYLGRGGLIRRRDKDQAKKVASIIVRAVEHFSAERIGALIIIERQILLNDHTEHGTILDSALSEELLGAIFYEGAPLHDGAAIIRGDRIYAAGCILPLSSNRTLSRELGTRHRAGTGITENSDAIAVIVSEETGVISIAIDGNLTRFLDLKTVEKTILNSSLEEQEERKPFADAFKKFWKKAEGRDTHE